MHNANPTLPEDKLILSIQPDEAGQRLDRYLATVLGDISRTGVQQLITDGMVLVNGRTSKSAYALRAGDEVQIYRIIPTLQPGKVKPQPLPLDIVYEDRDLLVVNKAAGMVVHPAPGHSEDTLVNALLAHCPELQGVGGGERTVERSRHSDAGGSGERMMSGTPWSHHSDAGGSGERMMSGTPWSHHSDEGGGNLRPGIVHRLDKDTSGLMIVAKNARTLAALTEQMKQHKIIKRYLALVDGIVSLDKGSIDAPIGRDPHHRQQMAITATGSREARTHFRVLQRFARHTLLLLQLETGRTHQIRVHLKAIGHSVVGDPVYGSSNSRRGLLLKRQFLHAYQLRFTHPVTGAILELEAPLPDDLQAVLDLKNIL